MTESTTPNSSQTSKLNEQAEQVLAVYKLVEQMKLPMHGINVKRLLREIRIHLYKQALAQTENVKAKACVLVGEKRPAFLEQCVRLGLMKLNAPYYRTSKPSGRRRIHPE